MKKYELIIENEACWGCKACEAACMQAFNFQTRYLRVDEEGCLEDGAPNFMYRVNVCKQCEDPICLVACPEGAISKKNENGFAIVYHNKDKCTGCNATIGKSGEEKQDTSPCKYNCPANNNVQGYVNLVAKGKFKEAIQIIKETSPFPSICGRVCHNPCESNCNRSQIDESVSIRSIERFIADKDMENGKRYMPAIKSKKKEKAAIIGSGPAGLSCAYYLAREGYNVTIFEKEKIAGGMLTQGIPAFRLPRNIVDAELKMIRDMGVEIKTGIEIGKDKTIAKLRSEGYKAFFIGIGTQKCLQMKIEGENLKGIYGGLDYLRKINLGEKIQLGNNVAVIGGGNTAIDAARSALRTSASKPFILYRRGMEEMPANPEEIEECKEEGIAINTLTQPVRFIGEGGKVKAIECVKMRLTKPDASGRRKPEPVKGSEFTVNVDSVITALGQEADWACLTPDCSCKLTEWGTMNIDPLTLQSSESDIFAGGDAVRGPRTVIEAIADGREAAFSIDRFIQGENLRKGREKIMKPIINPNLEKYYITGRALAVKSDPKTRVKNFEEVEKGIPLDIAVQEAERCVSCGISCSQSCPYNAISFDTINGKAAKCNLCYDRITNGLYPACADNICLAHCVYFGDPIKIQEVIDAKRAKRQCLY